MLATLALAIVLLFGSQAVLVAAVKRVRPHANVYAVVIAVSVLTAPLALFYGTHHVGVHPDHLGPDGRILFVLMHLALGGFLFHFMTLPDRSVTLRILVEILLAPGQALSTAALGERYGVRTMITSRLEQLSAGRFLGISGDGRIRLTDRGRAFGRFVTAGRRLFGIASAN
jgi:hypothetical protein